MSSANAWRAPHKAQWHAASAMTAPGQSGSFDDTYRKLLGAANWTRLRPEIRQRFSQKPVAGRSITYVGHMLTVELSLMGWLFAQACRLIGSPLAPYVGKNVPATVALTLDEALAGVAWRRTYQFYPGRRFTVCSTKSRGQDGTLIEHIGCGFSMRLQLSERGGNLVFTSTAYQLTLCGRSFEIPPLLTPGVTTVTHEQIAGDKFRFRLSVDHPLLGCTMFQDGEFYSGDVNDR